METYRVLRTVCVVFAICTAAAVASPAQTLTAILSFSGANGASPIAGLTEDAFGSLYGTTFDGGANGVGAIFNAGYSGATTLHSFGGADGSGPYGALAQGANGLFYGTTLFGGAYGYGTVFSVDQFGDFTLLHSFGVSDGAYPWGGLVLATDENFYGTTDGGGAYNFGTVFRITPTGTVTVLHSFSGNDGVGPVAGLVQATDGNLYGTTTSFGANGKGTVFKISLAGTLTTLHSFDGADGSDPYGTLVQATDGNFYGTTLVGGTGNVGTVFRITSTGVFTTLHSFAGTDGSDVYGGLVQATDGNLYGTTKFGGANGYGTVFKVTLTGALTTVQSFNATNGAYPESGIVEGTDGNLYGTSNGGGAYGDGTVFELATALQPETNLYSFSGPDGSQVQAALVQGTDGNLYGTALLGGNMSGNYGVGYGTVFKMTPLGVETTLYDFCSQTGCTDGSFPLAALVLGTDGNLYGITDGGGTGSNSICVNTYSEGCGTVFKITPGGTLTTLHDFAGTDGAHPSALLLATDGNFYGTTGGGGAYGAPYGAGTVFRMTPSGMLTTLYSFCAQPNCDDGIEPTGLMQATDGNFYGVTSGGDLNAGTVFKLTPTGALTTLHSFNGNDGSTPESLVQATDGNFYGTTEWGPYGGPTIFEITPGGTLSTLQNSFPWGGEPFPNALVQATDGNLYGTVAGAMFEPYYDAGLLYEITQAGTMTTLHYFCSQANCTDGESPGGALVQATDGNLYGTTSYGGTSSNNCDEDSYYVGCGTVFKLSVGMGPFVKALPISGIVGAPVIVLGTNLTGATQVRFNGTLATFTVVSASEITTAVPDGATTGSMIVATPTGMLKSNVVFRVTPQLLSFTPPSGPPGTVVSITGVSLTQTAAVAFSGVRVTAFTVVSDTEVQATVPTGAKTGHIAITTPGGTATSSGVFKVTSQ